MSLRPATPAVAAQKPPASQRITYPQTAESSQEASATLRLKPEPAKGPEKAELPLVVGAQAGPAAIATNLAPAQNKTSVAAATPAAGGAKPKVVRFPAQGQPSQPEASVAKNAKAPLKIIVAESDVGCTCHIDQSRCAVHGAGNTGAQAPQLAKSSTGRHDASSRRPGAADLAASQEPPAGFSKLPWNLPHFFDRSIELEDKPKDAAPAPGPALTIKEPSAPPAVQAGHSTLAARSSSPAPADAADSSRRTADRSAIKSAAPPSASVAKTDTPWRRPAADAADVVKTDIHVAPAFDPKDSVFADIRGGLLGGPPLEHMAALDRKPPATLPGASAPTQAVGAAAAPTAIVQTPPAGSAAQPAAPAQAPAAMMLLVQPGAAGAPASAQWVAIPALPGTTAPAPAAPSQAAPAAQQRSGPPPSHVVANFRYGSAAQEAGATPMSTQPMGSQEPAPSTEGGAQQGETPTLGEEPETNTLQFLRTQTILLDPGEYEIDISLQYSVDNQDFVLTELQGPNLVIAEAQRRSRVLIAPIEFRYGWSERTQVFVNVPVGWANSEVDFLGRDVFSNNSGIGDVSAGMIRQFLRGNAYCPDGLFTLAFSAPTGDVDVVSALSVPGSALGEGFWSITMGFTFIQTYDPVVLFYGFGYRERFTNTLDGFRINPGDQFFYRAGMGFAVNPRVVLSAAFTGNYFEEDEVNGVRIGGTIREPMYLRFAATISKYAGKDDCDGGVKTVEPYVNFGLTEESIDTIFGISWTR
jgi:hypothetical protein